MAGRWAVERKTAVKAAAWKVKKGFDKTEVCETVVQTCYSDPAAMTQRQFDSFVADVTACAERFRLGSIVQEVR